MLVRRLARPLLASYFVYEGLNNVRTPKAHAEELAPFVEKAAKETGVPNDPELIVRGVGGAQLVGAALLGTGRFPRPAAVLLGALMGPSTYVHEGFWAETDPARKAQKKSGFFRNAAILGGVILAAVDTAGKPSLRWRAAQGADQSRRGARRAARAARREAKLLATQAGSSLP
ncbi:DoxX family protein [Luteipulveratus sp. YIM 133132]|uniref:DoxX family protein n=1 Tax=Luteipulveratus flavus TaxID=3031728 RepID=UPI0023B19449|nr:DoxX family protein [Luteipulveratus sp. YIM 133132]MDE9365878.1 DoxX family protein [Luteipulveratus sp. YIM 133132]